jgi:hypothetical protein
MVNFRGRNGMVRATMVMVHRHSGAQGDSLGMYRQGQGFPGRNMVNMGIHWDSQDAGKKVS